MSSLERDNFRTKVVRVKETALDIHSKESKKTSDNKLYKNKKFRKK